MKKENAKAQKKEIQVVLKDGTNLVLVTFGKNDKELKVPSRSGNEDVDVPRYVYFSKSNYGYDKESGTLAKLCRKCDTWFAISKLTAEGSWVEIYNKDEVYFDETRFRSACNACHDSDQSGKADQHAIVKTKPDKKIHGHKESSNSDLGKKSIYISEEDHKFIRLLSVIDGVTIPKVFAIIIEKERKERNLKF